MKKSDVNGANTNEVYQWLKNRKSGLLGLSMIKVRLGFDIARGNDGNVFTRNLDVVEL